ncbi:type IX secretion system anionic LPS delivery protein PorZ [Flavobacterium turcicum]|uniref:T9SS type A sorting domain-containing protein n=1 Tax=Flavobacterium turcicum TaxID=2764718 RepID=A0ABR7JCF5_9FLAO|nr:T9SS type A sorting domain-containing protein [Flavobacterium turcicum]MBC5862114.1 T9SS type A sorting domain-containing protein [Flavobacterium turcicum]NHL00845.1 T9SS type A sorting domain-containing protein [Flavobacterium turcicum]
MKKQFFTILFVLVSWATFAQNNLSWQGYFSYSQINAITETNSAVIAASENALFTRNAVSNEIKTTTTIDGLSGQTISALLYSKTANKTLIGYENGLLIVVNDADGSKLNLVDIINKQLAPNLKKINHFFEHLGIVYVACNFGIVQFNLTTLQFGDTYFIGDNGAEIAIYQTTVHNGFIYAATAAGIRSAAINNPNLNDFQQWQTRASGSWLGIAAFGADLYAVSSSGNIQRYNPATTSFTSFAQLPAAAVNMRALAEYLVFTTATSVSIYNSQMVMIRQISSNQIPDIQSPFTCATVLNNNVYIGTTANGLYRTLITAGGKFENTTPIGPSRNNIFSMQVTPSSVWTVYGDYAADYNPYPLDSFGISKYNSEGWNNIPYNRVLGAQSMTKIIVNPANEDEVYASSFFSGLLKIVKEVPTVLFNQTNSGLESLTFGGPNYIDIRINGTAFDKTGNLWVTNSRINNGIKVLRPNGQWQSFDMRSILSDPQENNFANIAIDRNGVKWLPTSGDGVIGFSENPLKFKKITSGADTGNLPVANVRTAVIDNRNQLWIGTAKGLRVVSNLGAFQDEEQIKANPIIIEEDNLAQELLFEQFITAIAVDGANNKWIGTADSGLFLVSPNGQETKYHFTINNSPLPSNTINDVGINATTGEVFIATSKGMISFKGTATGAADDLSNAYVYPNPVRPEFTGTVKVAGLIDRASVKITDVAGNLVHETIAQGGTIEWDTTAFGKYKVASGVYLIFIAVPDGAETKVKKVMIIR